MTWYHCTNTHKWGITEIMNFYNKEEDILLKIDVNWKAGSFYIQHEGDIEISGNMTELYSTFDEVTVDMLESGTEIFKFLDKKTNQIFEDNDPRFNHIVEGYWEEGINYLYDNGYEEDDPEFWIEGGFSIEKTEPPFDF